MPSKKLPLLSAVLHRDGGAGGTAAATPTEIPEAACGFLAMIAIGMFTSPAENV